MFYEDPEKFVCKLRNHANQHLAPKVNSTHSGRGIDVACVVSYLEGAKHCRHDGGQQRNGQLILSARMWFIDSTGQSHIKHSWLCSYGVQTIHTQVYKVYLYPTIQLICLQFIIKELLLIIIII